MQRIRIQTPPTFRFRPTLRSHGWITLAPFGHDDEMRNLRRVERLDDGTVVRLSVRAGKDEALEVEVERLPGEPTASRREEIGERLRRIFNLDLDLSPFYERLRGDEERAWVERAGAGRLLRSPTVWEDLAKTLMTTNTTWAGTRGMVRRTCTLGEPYGDAENGAALHAFPSPQRIAALGPDRLAERIRAGYRAPYLHELASGIAEEHLDVEAWSDPDLPSEELSRRIRELRGFGPYAAGALLKLLGHYDQLAVDSSVRAFFSQRHASGRTVTDREIEAHYAPHGEWRGLVLWMDLLHHHWGEELDRVPQG